MTSVIFFPKHMLVDVFYGELTGCATCGGVEGDMPTDCPQRRLTHDERNAILVGRLDYRNQCWVEHLRCDVVL